MNRSGSRRWVSGLLPVMMMVWLMSWTGSCSRPRQVVVRPHRQVHVLRAGEAAPYDGVLIGTDRYKQIIIRLYRCKELDYGRDN